VRFYPPLGELLKALTRQDTDATYQVPAQEMLKWIGTSFAAGMVLAGAIVGLTALY
jgi:hypothetical protein